MANQVPMTGHIMYDAAIATVFFFFGIFFVVRYGSRFGWFAIACAILWAYLLYQRM